MDSEKTALLVVDMQNDYFPGGKMELHGSVEAGRRAAQLLGCFRQRGWPVIFIQHISVRPGGTFFLPGTVGADIYGEVQPLLGETVIQKHFPNSFRETVLLDHLREALISRLIVCGMMTHMCIDATVRAAFDYGYNCLLAADACATKDLQFQGNTIPAEYVHRSFLAALHGTYGKVMNAAEVISFLEKGRIPA